MTQKQIYPRPGTDGEKAAIGAAIGTPPVGVQVVKAILGDPRVVEFFTICLDKMSEPVSRVHISVEPIVLSAEEARSFIAQDRVSFITHQLEKARRAGDDKLADILRKRLESVSTLL